MSQSMSSWIRTNMSLDYGQWHDLTFKRTAKSRSIDKIAVTPHYTEHLNWMQVSTLICNNKVPF